MLRESRRDMMMIVNGLLIVDEVTFLDFKSAILTRQYQHRAHA